MPLSTFFDDVAAGEKTLVVYSSDDVPAIDHHFDTRHVTVEYESLPDGGPYGFVVLRDADGFVGAFRLAHLDELLSPPLVPPWASPELTREWASLYGVLDETVFCSFDRRQLLGVTREIENRAWRIGDGTVRAGFQSASAFRDQAGVYRRLAAETDLSIHVYLADDWDRTETEGITVYPDLNAELDEHWTVVYDAAGDPTYAGALLASERDPASYVGFWTYDPDRVDAMKAYLHEQYE